MPEPTTSQIITLSNLLKKKVQACSLGSTLITGVLINPFLAQDQATFAVRPEIGCDVLEANQPDNIISK